MNEMSDQPQEPREPLVVDPLAHTIFTDETHLGALSLCARGGHLREEDKDKIDAVIKDRNRFLVEAQRLSSEEARYRFALDWIIKHGLPTLRRLIDPAEEPDYLDTIQRHVVDALEGKDLGGVPSWNYRPTDSTYLPLPD